MRGAGCNVHALRKARFNREILWRNAEVEERIGHIV
jgi:hypothetical protein